MAKLRVFELKNIINEEIHGNIESKDILNFLEQSLGVKKTHSSNLEDHEVKAVKEHFIPSATKTSEPPTKNVVRTASQNSEIGQELSLSKEAQSNAPQKEVTGHIPGQPRQGIPVQAGQVRPAVPARPQAASPARTHGQIPKGVPQGQGIPGIPHGSQASGVRPNVPARPVGAGQDKLKQAGAQSKVNTGSSTVASGGLSKAGTANAVNQTDSANTVSSASSAGATEKASVTAKENAAGMTASAKPAGIGAAGKNASAENTGAVNVTGKTGTTVTAGNINGAGKTSSADSSNKSNAATAAGTEKTGTSAAGGSKNANMATAGSVNTINTSTGGAGKENTMTSKSVNKESATTANNTNKTVTNANPANNAGQQVRTAKEQNKKGQKQKSQTSGGNQGKSAQNVRQSGQEVSKQQGSGPAKSQQTGSAKPQGQSPKGKPGSNKGQKYQREDQKSYGQARHDVSEKTQGQQKNYGKDQHKPGKDETVQKSTGGMKGSISGKTKDRKDFDQQMLEQKVSEKNEFTSKKSRDRFNRDKMYKDKDASYYDEEEIILTKIKKGQFVKPKPVEEKKEEIKVITLPEVLTIKELADKMKVPSSTLIKKLFLEGKVVTINQEITFDEAEEIALEFDIIAEKEVKVNELEELLKDVEEDPSALVKRPPVVCVMGHVDHGKTSLLDAIRQTNVTAKEAGGITQHIGAYMVDVNGEKITFIDTPGHEAFTSMRMRGAQATDIAILVVAADDGVMPQTVEAISHAKAAGVQIIVAINKIDKPSANIERVKQELTEYDLIAEDWGGDTIMVPVSAHTKEGLNDLLEMILLTAEMAELKANPNRKARGLVIEAKLDKGRGPVATVLVQKGTLKVGDNIVIGSTYGKVRAMIDDKGRKLKEAPPSTPVEVLGLNSVPDVGEIFVVTDTEKEARHIADVYIAQSREKLVAETKSKITLDGLFSQIQAGNLKELNLIIKADVQGSVEALKQSMVKLSNDEVAVRVIHGGVGAINESDVILASTSNAIIIGFNVKPDNIAKERAEQEKVEIKLYKVIYNAINDVEAAIKGLLEPVYEEQVIGHAEVRQTFRASGIGTIAGSYVTDGKIVRNCKARIYRDKELVFEGGLASLKRFQDDVKEVAAGFECGLVFDKFNDVKVNDKIEFYIMAEVPR